MKLVLSLCFLAASCASLKILDFYTPTIGLGKEEELAVDKEKMSLLMDTTVDPCDDFLEYACGGWRNIPDFMNIFAIHTKKLKLLFENPGAVFKAEMPAAAKEFNEKCMRESANAGDIVTKNAEEFKKRMLEEAEGGNFDFWKALANLTRMGVEPLLEIKKESDEDGIFWLIQMKDQSPYAGVLSLSRKITEKFGKVPKGPTFVPAEPDELPDLVESIDLRAYLSTRFEEDITQKVYLDHPEIINELGELVKQENTTDLIDYLYLQCYNTLAGYYENMCEMLTEEVFRYQIILAIAEEDFPPEIQKDIIDLGSRIQREQLKIFNSVSWFDAHTREEALEKVRVVQNRLSVNTTFTSNECITKIYEGFEVTEDHYVNLMISYNIKNKLNKCLQNVEYFYFMLSVLDINAAFFIEGGLNIYIFPGILLPPFYKYDYPEFKKYSGIGAVFGHEYMHNFDRNDIKKDSTGARVDWWTPRLTSKLTRQYECAYTHYNKQYNIDGLLTLEENVPDILGLQIAYEAYKTWQEETDTSAEQEMEGFEELGLNIDQLFFVNYAQSICLLGSSSINATSSEGDVHSPPAFRVRGSVSNSEYFAKAFNCPVGSAMNPRRKCKYFV